MTLQASTGPELEPSSFRDPDGRVFRWQGHFCRGITTRGVEHLQSLVDTGLYSELTSAGWLIPHDEWDANAARGLGFERVLVPRQLNLISYPNEWCHSQLLASADLTLRIQQRALRHDMSMADASAFNIQLDQGDPTLIDTLSIKRWNGLPTWDAYRQCCRQFLAPLALGHYRRMRPGSVGSPLEGPTLETASQLLPWSSWLRPGLLVHLHLHARAQRLAPGRTRPRANGSPRRILEGLAVSLQNTLRGLTWKARASNWTSYYQSEHDSGHDYSQRKKGEVRRMLEAIAPSRVLDLGANTGEFSQLALERSGWITACDADEECVEQLFHRVQTQRTRNLAPLVMNLMEPTPAMGWNGRERAAFHERARSDVTLVLAVVHHLCIGANLPIERLPDFFQRLSPHLIIEFVGPEDPMTQRLAGTRMALFSDYTRDRFEAAFSKHYKTIESVCLTKAGRTLYWLERRGS